MNQHLYEFSFPMANPHDGAPLGNGAFGVLVWGGNVLKLTVSRNDFWDRRNGQCLTGELTYRKLVDAWSRGDDAECRRLMRTSISDADGDLGKINSSLLPMGRFELSFRDDLKPAKMVLDIRTGILDVHLGGSVEKLSLFLSQTEDVLVLEDPAGLVTGVTALPSWELTDGALQGRGFPPPVSLRSKGQDGWTQANPGGEAGTVLCSGIGTPRLLVATALGKDAGEAKRHAAALLASAEMNWDGCLEKNRQWWCEYWRDVPGLVLPDPFFNRFFPFALYKFACATNPRAKNPSPLQGPWVEDHRLPPWSGSYTINVNIQQIYTFALYTGKYGHMTPLFNMFASAPVREVMRSNARTLLGIDDGFLPTHCLNDRARHCQNGFSAHSAIDPSGASWLAWLHWLRYRHTGDLGFLRDCAYPFILGVMRVYEEMLEEHDGRLSLPLGPSPEYGVSGKISFRADGRHIQEGRDPSAQLACIHMLVDILLETSDILGLPRRPAWTEIKRRLPLYTLVGTGDDARIALWEGQDLEICHRHHSHLSCFHPFDTLGEPDETVHRIVDNTIDHWVEKGAGLWSEWGMPWAASIQAKQGLAEAPMVTLGVWKELFVNAALATVYIPKFRGICAHRKELIKSDRSRTEIMQLDGTMACAGALCDILIHERAGALRLFKGAPAKWCDVSFRNLRVPGGFRVSARRQDGRIVSLQVQSDRGGRLKIEIDGRVQEFDFLPGQERELAIHQEALR